MIKNPPSLPQPTVPWIDPKTGKPTPIFFQYLVDLDRAIRALIVIANTP